MKSISLLLFFTTFLTSQNEVCFEIESNPNPNNSALSCFSKYVNVLDCFDIYAQSTISDEKVLHVAAIAAELLDNNEDGFVDDESVFEAMCKNASNRYYQTLDDGIKVEMKKLDKSIESN